MSTIPTERLKVSLEPHLRQTLVSISSVLPGELLLRLEDALSSPAHEIHYTLLADISKWTRSSEGRAKLTTSSAALNPSEYSMISLLAGSKTSPGAKLPPYVPPETEAVVAKRQISDRKAITAIINSILSIAGAGAAAWWAAGNIGWRDEYRILLALLVAIMVAASELILYAIWQSRASKKLHSRLDFGTIKKRDAVPPNKAKDPTSSPCSQEESEISSSDNQRSNAGNLRRRTGKPQEAHSLR